MQACKPNWTIISLARMRRVEVLIVQVTSYTLKVDLLASHGEGELLCGTAGPRSRRLWHLVSYYLLMPCERRGDLLCTDACGRSLPGLVSFNVGRDECKAQVDHYQGARYKKFPTRQEAEAFVQGGSSSSLTTATSQNVAASSQKKRAHEPQQQHFGSPISGPSSSTITGRPTVKASGSLAQRRLAAADSTSSPSLVRFEEQDTINPPEIEDDGVRVIEVYTDGASSNNGQKGAAAGYGVYWPEGDGNAQSDLYGLDVSERLDGELQTNNRAELMVRAVHFGAFSLSQEDLYSGGSV